MFHAELGRHPVKIDINLRMLNFWLSLVNSKPNKLSHSMYNLLRAETNSGIYEHKWIKHMQKLLQETGRADVWLTQTIYNTNAFKASVKRTLLDQNIQQWHTLLDISSKGKTTGILKVTYDLKITDCSSPKSYTTHLYDFVQQTINCQSN